MNLDDVKAALQQANAEIEADRLQAMTGPERKLHQIAQRLLLLERDLRAPGSARTLETRVERLLEAIAKESF